MTTIPRALGPIMEEARQAAGLTQVELAKLLGTSRWTYNRLVNGHTQLRAEWIKKLPLPIREPVIRYLQRQHDAQWDMLDQWLKPEPPRRIKRPMGAVQHP